jgi:PEP-CTERM motif
MRRHLWIVAAITALGRLSCTPAAADSLPPAFYNAVLEFGGEVIDPAQRHRLESDSPGGFTDSDNMPRSYSYLPEPVASSLSGSSAVSGPPNPGIVFSASLQYSGQVGAGGTVQYWFEVNGPAGPVGVRLNGSTGITLPDEMPDGAVFGGTTSLLVTEGINTVYSWLDDQVGDNSDSGFYIPSISDVIDQTFTLQTNTAYAVEIDTFATIEYLPSLAGDLNSNVATAKGYFDLSLALAVPNDRYSLAVSDGVGNAMSTPEPSTWAMMALGFVSLGWLGVRGRKSARLVKA